LARANLLFVSLRNHFATDLKNRKTYGSVLVRFFSEKCILERFLSHLKKSRLQPARYEAFTKGAKTGHLCDTVDFANRAANDDFLRNLLKINQIALKNALSGTCQNRVTYNNMPSTKP
jgi:hypothetical protein